MRKVLEQCPGCGNELEITQLSCSECDMVITGHFTSTRFGKLNQEHLRFAELFLRFRGNIKEMERELGLSYPTVRGRLTDVIRSLGFDTEEESSVEELSSDERKTVLSQLEQGDLSVTEAVELLRKSKK